jgi:eukaryotic-like serine/threonine-protein kinase
MPCRRSYCIGTRLSVSMVPSLSSSQTLLAQRYSLRREIGLGATSRVFLADDLATGLAVAVKVLHPELIASTTAARFRREISFLQQLRHPNLLPVLDSGDDAERLFFVMPYVDGETLTTRLARVGCLALDEAVRILRSVADGVDYAHARGIIHRDIKPGNILLDPPRVLLCDFGIGRAIFPGDGDVLSSSGLVIGTCAYMSPEQAGGDRVIDSRADIYGLGCVAFEMLTGETPFPGSTSQATLWRHVTEPPRSVRSVRPDVPASVEAAVHAAMAKNPDDRPQTAAAFVASLDVERG